MPGQEWESSRVIDVRMREDDGVDLVDGTRQACVLLTRLAAPSLKHAAVEQNGLPIDSEDVTGARDLAGGTGELDLHAMALSVRVLGMRATAPRSGLALGRAGGGSALPVAWTLEYECEAMCILRHHCRPPASPTTLVQEIGERILVVTRMPRQA